MVLKCLNKQRWVWSREAAEDNREALLATGMISSISTTFLLTGLDNLKAVAGEQREHW